MKWLEIESRLLQTGFNLFTDKEFRRVTGATPVSAKFLLIRYTRRGLFLRLKRGLYALKSRMPSKWAIAGRLYRPSYISLSSALSYYGLIPESVYSVTLVTTRTTREFESAGTIYLYRSIKVKAFGGYKNIEIGGENILIAEKEKALADYLYFVFLKKERINTRLNLHNVNLRNLIHYLSLFENKKLMRWFKYDINIPDRRIKF